MRKILHLFTVSGCLPFNVLPLLIFSIPVHAVTIDKKVQSVIRHMKSHGMSSLYPWVRWYPDQKALILEKHMNDVIGAKVLNRRTHLAKPVSVRVG